ncbi:16S rRNA (guanine(527)-N(7))-methyltransferase RsmG [Altererythrobacter arenosus]|uniref:Ribosomal RNA small subunit methyltransferase G n=1 Tax=Altererythrobacter arenosus TaxID=3032592 RepID=A0ABY8FXE5_9SPHN|nr:16S rRNA (guanine(527)-N(7))-methyltransferase RsmG [Altererythrobacter sp. CAU 1644]WFL78663.1 16S rRNA (guanine(527)-N(7))-methyltransferase RsmG [Altererythrobacter sp. CAU 1644]
MIEDEASARRYVEELGDKDAIERLELMIRLLLEENARQNLISRPSEQQVWQRHIADSAQLLRFVPRETSGKWLDLGTGAGFPGLVIAVLRPDIPVFLVESRARRVEWLVRASEAMGLGNCQTIGQRLENVPPFAARFISARAFAPLPKLLKLSAPFSTKATTYLLPKGRSAAQELSELPKRSRSMFHVEQSLTDSGAGIIVSAGVTEVER